MTGESKQDILLRRIQIVLASLAALVSLVVGIYSFRNMTKSEPPPPPPPPQQSQFGNQIGSALEEAGASWIRKVAKPKEE